MIVIICGKPRVGKTALNTHFASMSMREGGRWRQKKCGAEIEAINAEYGANFKAPDIAPVYTNYEAIFNVGYKKYVRPFVAAPFYIGLPNEALPTQFILPYGELHITEGQRYWDSRESATLPDHVSRWFETHGHFGLDIYIDVQRAKLIDKNIRALAKKIIEVQQMVHIKDSYGRILRTIWQCREFSSSGEYETYVEGGAASYKTTHYTHEGNIFDCYNSRSCRQDFVPQNSDGFSTLRWVSGSKLAALPEDKKIYYFSIMPKAFRAAKRGEVNGTGNGNGTASGDNRGQQREAA